MTTPTTSTLADRYVDAVMAVMATASAAASFVARSGQNRTGSLSSAYA